MTFPNVPIAPGIPPVPRDPAAFAAAAVVLLLEDAPGILNLGPVQQWGIYLNGQAVVLADNVISVEYKQDWSISDYPVEKGAFESYDKVYRPFDVRLRFSAGGSFQARQQFIDSLNAISGTLDRYDVYTPETTYHSVNVIHQGYARQASDGLGLIKADVYLLQVKEDAAPTFTNTATPAGASPVHNGTVQAQPVIQKSGAVDVSGFPS